MVIIRFGFIYISSNKYHTLFDDDIETSLTRDEKSSSSFLVLSSTKPEFLLDEGEAQL